MCECETSWKLMLLHTCLMRKYLTICDDISWTFTFSLLIISLLATMSHVCYVTNVVAKKLLSSLVEVLINAVM